MSAEMWTRLAERAEKATRPDRELDAAVWWSVNKRSAERSFWNAAFGLPRPLDDDFDGLPAGLGRLAVVSGAPRYTASVDAVLALIAETLPGWTWEMTTTGFMPGASLIATDHLRSVYGAYAATPALAILAALCRAKAAQAEAGGSPS